MGDSFKDLLVRQRAMQLTVAIYKLTTGLPSTEQFRLTDQLRRAPVSVASKIAEGYGRSIRGEDLQFLGHARGSILEVQTQLVIFSELGLGQDDFRESANGLSEELSRMLIAKMKKLRN
jgi:four helix bundle protein